MKYSTDRAITNIQDDLLGRASFSQQLGNAIYEYKGQDSLVIGLYGKWGTGKTSVVNMALQSLEKCSESDENKPIIMKFAPWNYSNRDDLISQFFKSLKTKIDIDKNEDLKKTVGQALNDYAGLFDVVSLVPGVGSVLSSAMKTAAQASSNALLATVDLEQTRQKLEKALIGANKKIVVLIDDIDRLTNSQIRDVFQLVKQVCDLPNIIYILAMDREVVKRALTEVHNFDGNEYLEKIVQIPFEIPALSKSKLNNIFFNKLDDVINQIPDEIVWDQQYWNKIFSNCIDPYIHTLRDVNRVINTFQFRYSMVYQETSFEDMIGISTLEVLVPELYKWIAQNKDAVCGSIMHGLLSNSKKPDEFRKSYVDEFQSIGVDPEKAIRSVAAMFPVFARDVNETFYYHVDGTGNITNIRSQMRAAQEERFEIYFMFDMETVAVPRGLINACAFKLEKEELIKVIKEVNEKGNMVFFMNEFRALVDKIPYERLGLIISVLYDLRNTFEGETFKAIFPVSACDMAEYCASDLMKKLRTDDERYSILCMAIKNVNKQSLGSMGHVINRIELAYARLAGDVEKKEDQIITLAQLEKLEKEYVKKINAISKTTKLVEIEDFYMIFYLWSCYNPDEAKDYLKNGFEDDVFKLKFICRMAGKWNGTNGTGWSFDPKNYVEYISDEEVYNLILGYAQDNLEKFTELEQIQLASFVLNYKKDRIDHVPEQKAQQLVQKWKTDFM
ncbi:KAP family P-loop NTPase fold protein [Butyrivibrio fibrisolvens]|uniref:KAP family P-loop NTPase fold protein n=1 Tax=Butyrivibrio fibrisolvens TaxID=831 RepID=UPI00040F5290|nr:P-loop NTPase fold protein [Butyrivibrio fibrisolvens]